MRLLLLLLLLAIAPAHAQPGPAITPGSGRIEVAEAGGATPFNITDEDVTVTCFCS